MVISHFINSLLEEALSLLMCDFFFPIPVKNHEFFMSKSYLTPSKEIDGHVAITFPAFYPGHLNHPSQKCALITSHISY